MELAVKGGADRLMVFIYEYYFFKNLQYLRGKDPGTFPGELARALLANGVRCQLGEILDGYGLGAAFRCFFHFWRHGSNHISVLFHLTLRTLAACVIFKVLHPRAIIVVKADFTPKQNTSWRQKVACRLLDRLAIMVIVETPEGEHQLRGFGMRRAVFVPNPISVEPCLPMDSHSRDFDFMLVSRSNDSRKRPDLTRLVAMQLSARGHRVVGIGIDSTGVNGMVKSEVSRAELHSLLGRTRVFVGLSASESYWFVAAEAAALGSRLVCTSTGIVPFLAERVEAVTLIDEKLCIEPGQVDAICNQAEEMLGKVVTGGAYHINDDAHSLMVTAAARLVPLLATQFA